MTRKFFGYILIFISAFGFLMMYCQVANFMYADFPCYYGYPSGRPANNSDSRISYCISYIGRNAVSGGGIYSEGESSQDAVSIQNASFSYSPINLERTNGSIMIRGQRLQEGETYGWKDTYLTINPWVVATARFEISNKGKLMDDGSTDTIYVEGEIEEGWILNPLGILLLITGIFLIRGKTIPRGNDTFGTNGKE